MTTTERLLDIRADLQAVQRLMTFDGSTVDLSRLGRAIEDIAVLVEDIERAVPGTVMNAQLVPSTWAPDDAWVPADEDDMLDRAAVVLGPEGIV